MKALCECKQGTRSVEVVEATEFWTRARASELTLIRLHRLYRLTNTSYESEGRVEAGGHDSTPTSHDAGRLSASDKASLETLHH